jgi:hypothetical protein
LFGFAPPEWSYQRTIDYPPFELSNLRTTRVENITIMMKTTYVRYMRISILWRWWRSNKEIWKKKNWRRARRASLGTERSLACFHVVKLIRRVKRFLLTHSWHQKKPNGHFS